MNTRFFCRPLLACSLMVASSLALSTHLDAQTVVATDDFEGTIAYNSPSGTGFGVLTYLAGNGGGVFADTDTRKIAGNQSLGIFSGSGAQNTQELGLALANSATVNIGTYNFSARFDVDNGVGATAFNIKSGLGTAFAANELVSFGLSPGSGNNGVFVTDSSGTRTIDLGTELRGSILDFQLAFNTTTGAYTLGARVSGSPAYTNLTGTLKDSNGAAAGFGALAALGFENLNTGNNQNLIADSISVASVPEPSTLALIALSGFGWLRIIRRRS